MIRKLLATTAIVTVMAGGAYAAEAPMNSEQPMQTDASADRFTPNLSDAALASQIMGETIYTSTADDAEAIGEVNDLIVANDGSIESVVVAVGGFLGVGEKTVAVKYQDLELTAEDDGTQYFVLNTSKEELENAPEFDAQAAVAPAGNDAAPSEMAAKEPMANDTMAKEPMAGDTGMAANNAADNDTTPNGDLTSTAPDRTMLKAVDVGTISSDNVIGAAVYTQDDENVGEVGEVVLTDDGEIDAVVIDVGGFLGIGAKPVAVAFSDLEFKSDEDGEIYIYTNFTQDQLEAAAAYDKDSYDENRDAMLLRRAS
jgi:sporulation protein YlmC with PRC-barrel domain